MEGKFPLGWIIKTDNGVDLNQILFQGKSLSYYDRAKSMTDLSGVGSIIGADVSGKDSKINYDEFMPQE